jgi:hypothetical protein
LSHRMQLRQFSPHAIQQTQLEANEVVIDAHPMAGVFPVLGLKVLALEGTMCRYQGIPGFHSSDYKDVRRPCYC